MRPAIGARPADLHWLGEPMETVSGALGRPGAALPTFARVPFGANPSLDVIVGKTPGHVACGMPVAVVSKSYVLVQHRQIVDAACEALRARQVDPDDVAAEISLSERGTRMAVCLRLPERYSVRPADGHPLDLTFECFNSVDKSVPLFAALGWFRLVCSNGLLVGTTSVALRHRHAPPLQMADFAGVMRDGLGLAQQERAFLETWSRTPVGVSALVPWVDGPVTAAWGALAAGRVYHIARTGHDGQPGQRFTRVKPHERAFESTAAVPGAPDRSETHYDVAQALSWVASHRRDFQERLAWRAQIPGLMKALAAGRAVRLSAAAV